MSDAAGTIRAAKEARLVALHDKARFVGLNFVVPAAGLTYIASAIAYPRWQTYVLAAGAIAMSLLWVVGFRIASRGRIEPAVRLISLSGLGFGSLVLLLREGSNVSMVVIFLGLTAYVALFSWRSLMVTSAIALVSIIGTEVVHAFELIPTFALEGHSGLAIKIMFVGIFYPIATYFLRQAQLLNETLLAEVEKTNQSQGELISTVGRIQPELQLVVGRINEVASGFASQASQQAATSRQVNESTETLASMVAETAEAAADTRLLAERTRTDSLTSSEKLREIEGGFQDALSFAESVRGEIDALADEIQRTEEINEAMRDIAERLKMLSVNAGLEAAKAGEDGRGFGVIAVELRRMIARTSEDLVRSRLLLEGIRGKASQLSGRARHNTENLRHFFDELQETGALISSIAETFALASQRVGSITEAAQRQQLSIQEVSQAMRALDEAAAEMTPAASNLAEGVAKLVTAHGELRELLGGGARGSPHSGL